MINIIQGKHDSFLSSVEFGALEGFPILVQHGLIASISDSHLFERLVAANVHLICIARPGYGESSPYLMQSYAEWGEIISPLISRMNLTRFDILGISSGAPYAYALGSCFPERARNIYILSGMPALYDQHVRSEWPHPLEKNANISDMQTLAHDLFFVNLSDSEKSNLDVRDSMRNDAFGVAQDLRLRGMNWGFRLSQLKQKVFMHHSKSDESVPFQTALRTAELLGDCQFQLTESDVHFSKEVLDQFIDDVIIPEIVSDAS